MRALLLICLVAAPACDSYARIARTNAPGVVDISTPIARENGSDELYETPAYDQPGSDAYVVWLHPAFGGGLVRSGAGFELGVGVSIEKDSNGKGSFPLTNTAWGASLAMGIVQFRNPSGSSMTTTESGPLSLEAYYRKFVVMFAAGAVVYPDTRDAGAQVTIHAPISHVRFRYVQNSGFEVMLAYDFNFPLVFGWSR
jgi:hypothetical protein